MRRRGDLLRDPLRQIRCASPRLPFCRLVGLGARCLRKLCLRAQADPVQACREERELVALAPRHGLRDHVARPGRPSGRELDFGGSRVDPPGPRRGRLCTQHRARTREAVLRGGAVAARGRDVGDGRMGDALDEPARVHAQRAVSQPLCLVPAPGAGRAMRRLAQQHRAVAGAESQRLAGLDGVERELRGLVDPARLIDAVAQVDVGAPDVVGLLQLERDRQRLAQRRLTGLVLALTREAGPERVERLPLLGARADRTSDGERLLAAHDRFAPAAPEHEDLPLAATTRARSALGGSAGSAATASR